MEQRQLESRNRTYHEAQSHMELLPNYYRWTYRKFRTYLHGEIVELGCGAATGITTYLESATRVFAVDYNPKLLEQVRERYPAEKVTTIAADLIGDWKELESIHADSIIMMDVLEHFADDRRIIEKARSLLKPFGHLLIKVPAQRALFSAMDEASGHFRRYDEHDLVALLETGGFRAIGIRHINPIGALAYRVKMRRSTNFSRTFSKAQLRLINAVLPLLSLMDSIPGLLGLSLAGIFQRLD
jgi:SAM-dependent methyltransferase